MIYKLFGNTGLNVSIFSLGTWLTFNKLTDSEAEKIIFCALELGVNLFDTAEIYGAGLVESKLGRIFKKINSHNRFLVSTKIFWGGDNILESGLNRKHILHGCDASLKRLNLEYIDFYLCHRPDYNTPLEETIIAMNLLIQKGKILYWGTSEWPKDLIIEAFYISKKNNLIPPSVEQFEYNMFCRSKGEVDFVDIKNKTGVAGMGTMPLYSGILAGRYIEDILPNDSRASLKNQCYLKEIINSSEGKKKINISRKIKIIGEDLGLTPAQVSLYWCMLNKNIGNIVIGASSIKQLKENIQSINSFQKNGISNSYLNKIQEIISEYAPSSLCLMPSYQQVLSES